MIIQLNQVKVDQLLNELIEERDSFSKSAVAYLLAHEKINLVLKIISECKI